MDRTSSPDTPLITIIGGGLCGLALAISLAQRGIPSTVYESGEPSRHTSGALMLSPNSIRILDQLGVYADLRCRGFEFDTVAYQDSSHSTVDQYRFGNKDEYGYSALRVYRQALLEGLRKKAAGYEIIQVIYGKKFVRVVEENPESVVFEFGDGETASAKVLVGADGIHSGVRRSAVEGVTAKYIGLMAVTGAAQTRKISWPKLTTPRDPRVPYPLPAQIYESTGTFVLAPNDPEASELLAGMQIPFPDQDRASWAALMADKDQLEAKFRKNYVSWSPLVRSIIDSIPKESMFIWPFNTMPQLKSWTSAGKRVIIMGDAAHAIPPTAGQGASQALEDAFSFAAVVEKYLLDAKAESQFGTNVEKWQAYRQDRVSKVLELTSELNERRKPGWVPNGMKTEDIDLDWLYKVNIAGDMARVLA